MPGPAPTRSVSLKSGTSSSKAAPASTNAADADRVGQAQAHLARQLEQRAPAEWVVVLIQVAGELEAEAAHRAAAAGVEAHIGRHLVARGAEQRADRAAPGEHHARVFDHLQIMGVGQPALVEREVVAEHVDERLVLDREPAAPGRVEQIVAAIPLIRHRQREETELLLVLAALLDLGGAEREPAGDRHAGREQALETGIRARRDALEGLGVVVGEARAGDQRLIAPPEIGLAERAAEMAADERAVELEREPLARAEQVAVLEAEVAAETFVGAIAQADADRAMAALVELDRDRQPAVGAGRAPGLDHDGAEQAGIEQRLAPRREPVRGDHLARLPGQPAAHGVLLDRREPCDADVPEAHERPGPQRQGQVHRVRAMVDHRPALAELGQRVALRAGPGEQRGFGVKDRLRGRRRAGRDAEILRTRQRRRGFARRHVDGHVAQAVQRSGAHVEPHADRLGSGIDRDLDLGIVVAARAQGLLQARPIVLRAAAQADQAGRRAIRQTYGLGHAFEQLEQRLVLDPLERDLVLDPGLARLGTRLRCGLRCRRRGRRAAAAGGEHDQRKTGAQAGPPCPSCGS